MLRFSIAQKALELKLLQQAFDSLDEDDAADASAIPQDRRFCLNP